MTQLVIENEAQFLEYLNGVLCEDKEPKDLRFVGWPSVNIDIKGKRYHSSLPTKLMEGFVTFQQELDRAYALIQYRVANRQKLTNGDKEALELVFKIEEGSTGASSPLGDWINGIIGKLETVFEDMSGKQKTALIALLIFCVTGSYTAVQFAGISSKLEAEVVKAEASTKAEAERTAQITELTETNEATIAALRDIMLKQAVEQSPKRARKVVDVMEEGYKNVVRSAQDAEQISIGEAVYSRAQIKAISEKPDIVRDVSEDSGEFYIESIKKKDSNMTVGVFDVSSEATFNIKIDTSFIEEEERETIHNAFRDNTKVKLHYQANLQNGEIMNARLIKVIPEGDDEQTAGVF